MRPPDNYCRFPHRQVQAALNDFRFRICALSRYAGGVPREDLFASTAPTPEPQEVRAARGLASAPLAARMRPRGLDEYVGQSHILAPGQLLRRAIEADRIQSLIFYGPPGTG